MFTKATHRRSLLAVVGATASVASVAATPSAATARAPEPAPVELREVPAGQLTPAPEPEPEVAPASHGTCLGWTRFQTNLGTYVFIPTTQQDNRQTHCILVEGNNTNGVYKLEDALDRCPPQQPITPNTNYNNETTAAVKRVQDFHNITADGDYGPQTRSAMYWPEFNSGGDFIGRCARLAF